MQPIKAIGTDLDGTLLPASKRISRRFPAIVRKLKQRDLLFFPVTGKTLSLTESIFSGLEIPMVCQDGAVIKVEGEELWDREALLPRPLVLDILERTREVSLFLLDGDVLYVRGDLEPVHTANWASRYGGDPGETSLERVSHLIIPHENQAFLKTVMEEARSRYSSSVRYYLSEERFEGRHFLILRSHRLSKYRGTRRLLARFGCSLEEVLFFGDWRNDIPLLKRAGFPVAMRNADSEVARFARAMTLYSNEELGVERFLESYFNLG